MSLPALIGFAGVLVAAVATGLLAGRAVRRPRLDTILCTAATLALTVALAAESMGFDSGFRSATFRAVQLFALFLAPLWLAWGLVELAWPSDVARFGTRLACGALTVVGSVILATDPLTAAGFSKAWPLAGSHYQPPSHYALDAGQAVAVILAAASIGLAVARARTDGPRNDRLGPGALPGTAVVALAVFLTLGMRFSLPSRSAYPLLGLLAAALAWFGATRLEARARRAGGSGRSGERRDRAGRERAAGDGIGRDSVQHTGVLAASGYDRDVDPYSTNGHRAPRVPGDPRSPGEPGRRDDPGRRPAAGPRPDWPRGAPGPAGWGPDGRPLGPYQAQPGAAAPGAGAAEFAPQAASAAPPYGRILIFTLLEDRVADFDRFAEQAAEEVRTREPDTLVYVIHLVPNAPMQRIFYEIYRDRAAFDSHENQPYMKRFVADRRACVLATNVIELRLKYAKVAPLPGPQPAGPPAGAAGPGPRGPLPPVPPRDAPRDGLRDGPRHAPWPQPLEPLPPRSDERLPPRGSDERLPPRGAGPRLPSAERRPGGI
jgi:quinol monooxygenase YgiN